MSDIPIYRRDFKLLAELRVEEARVLLRSRKPQGAYYLAGYAIECALKACIAKRRKAFEFPPKAREVNNMYSHDLDTLLGVASLNAQLDKEIAANSAFAANWNTVREWTVESRYRISGLSGRDMYNAVSGTNGVLQWIKARW